MGLVKQLIFLLKETVQEWQEDHASSIAAALAYYAIFSLSPLLILIALILGIVIDRDTISDDLFVDLENTVGEEATDTLRQMLESNEAATPVQSNAIGTVIWLSVVIWGASGLFVQLQNALNRIWEVKGMPGRSPIVFIKNRVISLLIVANVGALLLATMLLNTAVNLIILHLQEAADIAFVIRPVQFMISMVMLTLLFAIIFKILPDVYIAWRDVWVGAAFTGFLFFIGQYIVGVYLSNTSPGSVFGAAGSLTIILVWIYYSAQILLFGAEFTEVWARHYGNFIRPDNDAVWINEAQAKREAESAGVIFEDDPTKHRQTPKVH